MPLFCIARNMVLGDAALDPVDRAIGQIKYSLRARAAKRGVNLTHGPTQARNKLPTIASRSAKANASGLKQYNRKAFFGAGQSG